MKIFAIALAMLMALTACSKPTNEDLYAAAVEDAKLCESTEIEEVFELSEGENLLVSWNNFPEEFSVGEYYTAVPELEIWCISYKEFENWFDENSKGIENWNLRLEQLIGLPPEFGYTHFTAFTVKPEDVFRPAYVTDPTAQITAESLDGSLLGEYAEWFSGNKQWSYVDSAWPWTRLGYTYDWSKGNEKGLSEFIIKSGAEVKVEWTVSTEDFIAMFCE